MTYNIFKNKKILIFSLIFLICLISLALIKVAQAPENKLSFFPNKETVHILEIEEVTEVEKKEKTLLFVGDIMLSRQVNTKMENYNDYTWPFLKVTDFLNEADMVIANLESPFLKNTKTYAVNTGSFSFKANPLAVAGLKIANIKVISLANNHSINQGKQGIVDTIEILKENNILHAGAGLDENKAREPALIKDNQDTFAFLSYAYPQDYSLATEDRHGLAGMDVDKMRTDIANLKNDDSINLIAVLMHAGTEYVLEPNWQQKEFARAAIDAGADIVVGHHPHWPQIFEYYKDKPIIYSLGNFVFDQMWSPETRQGLILKLIWRDNIQELSLIPTKIYDYGQVEVLEIGRERSEILRKIKANDSGIIYTNNEK